ncbi:MAG TPA: hypothetical protein VFX79_01240 [Candidatus Saccharimonadales bacterium]|nr:hypothetical protein [Candidatus Saccharimonadales bacterium]
MGKFVDRQKRKAELSESRRAHGAKAFEMLDGFWNQFDMDDIDRRIGDYQRESGNGFRVHLSGLTFMPGAYQYPFVEVEDKKLALREMVEGEGRRSPRGSGEVTGYSLVVADDELPGPKERDGHTGEIAGEAVFANIVNGRIQYPDDSIEGDIELAEAADQEVLGYLQGVHEGMLEMLGNPEPQASPSN